VPDPGGRGSKLIPPSRRAFQKPKARIASRDEAVSQWENRASLNSGVKTMSARTLLALAVSVSIVSGVPAIAYDPVAKPAAAGVNACAPHEARQPLN